MAKYGLFTGGYDKPQQLYEGDSMVQNGEYVMIWKNQPGGGEKQVAAIRLDKNQSVKEL